MIVGFVGKIGGGKTLSMMKQVKKYSDAGYKIYSNIHLNIDYTPLDISMLLEYASSDEGFKKCVMIIDEAHIFIDSRRSVSNKNVVISYFLTQTRKKDVRLFYTTQRWNTVDKRLRENTDLLVECSTKHSKEGVVVKNVFISDDRRKVDVFVGNPYFKLYDTYEIVGFK